MEHIVLKALLTHSEKPHNEQQKKLVKEFHGFIENKIKEDVPVTDIFLALRENLNMLVHVSVQCVKEKLIDDSINN
jgi:hypothetical protein